MALSVFCTHIWNRGKTYSGLTQIFGAQRRWVIFTESFPDCNQVTEKVSLHNSSAYANNANMITSTEYAL